MPRPATDKRERLADAALGLAYERGLDRATISEIASHAGVAPGSVYYYFKTKDEVGRAIAERLASRYGDAMDGWDQLASPTERLEAFMQTYVDDSATVAIHGCPLGSVVAELQKQSPELGAAAGAVFARLVAWATQQFVALGYSPRDSADRGSHVIAAMQGAAALSSALGTAEPVHREARLLSEWIQPADAA